MFSLIKNGREIAEKLMSDLGQLTTFPDLLPFAMFLPTLCPCVDTFHISPPFGSSISFAEDIRALSQFYVFFAEEEIFHGQNVQIVMKNTEIGGEN